jgi:hypothetical protein
MIPDETNVTLVPTISAVQGKEGQSDVPLFLDNQALSKAKPTLVDLTQLDPATRTILMNIEQNLTAQSSQGGTTQTSSSATGTVRTMSVGEKIPLGGPYWAIVGDESDYILWTPIAVIDSVPGLTHSFTLSAYDGDSFQITASIVCAGWTVSATYSSSNTYTVTFAPITVSNGAIESYCCQFEHVYQSGGVYVAGGRGTGWLLVGHFEREYISQWYPLSQRLDSGADYPPTRANYLGEWENAASASVTMSSSTSWSGSIGTSVDRTDIFGASASITMTFAYTYGTSAAHSFVWNPPASNCYLDFYSGNAFDINVNSYYA